MRLMLPSFLLMLLLSAGLFAQGNTCANPIIVGALPYTTTDNTANYGNDVSGSPGSSCGSTSGYLNGDDVFYSWTATSTGAYDLSLTGIGGTYAGMFIYASCATVGTTCLDGDFNSSSTASLSIPGFPATMGTTYIIVISTWPTPQSTTYTLNITPPPPPPGNNDCIDAAPITVSTDGACSSPLAGTNVGATASGETPTPACSSFSNGKDNWYSVTVPANGEVTIEMTSAGGPTDWGMVVYAGTCGSLTTVECDDDDGIGSFPLVALTGRTPNEVLLVRVFEFGNNETGAFNICAHTLLCEPATVSFTKVDDCATSGGFLVAVEVTDLGSATSLTLDDGMGGTATLNAGTTMVNMGPYTNGTSVVITATPNDDVACTVTSGTLTQAVCPPANDECGGATPLVCNAAPIAGTTVAATDNADGLGCSQGRAVWYTFMGDGNEVTITADPDNSSYDIELAVATGSCGGAFTNVDCADTFDDEVITFVAEDGVNYYVTVGHFSTSSTNTGTFTIELACATCAPPTATATPVSDCVNTGTFNVDVNITSLGSATSLTISDGTTSMPATATGIVTFTGYAPGSGSKTFTITNDQDGSCAITRTATIPAACPPANDLCANATLLDAINNTVTAQNISLATAADAPNGLSCTGAASSSSVGPGVWYEFIGDGGDVTITAAGSGFDNELVVLSGACGSLTCLGSRDVGFNNGQETLTIPTISGVSYKVYTGAYGATTGNNGTVTVTLDFQSLPVELLSFTGQTMEKANKLTWATAREEASSHYVVERSVDATSNWVAVGEVAAAGYSTEAHSYELMDETPLASAFYRLRMTDLDGSFEYSEILQLKNENLLTGTMSVFPVPAGEEINVTFLAKAAGEAVLTLTDFNGRTLRQQTISVSEGIRTERVSLGDLPAGMYLLRLDADGRQLVKRIVRQ